MGGGGRDLTALNRLPPFSLALLILREKPEVSLHPQGRRMQNSSAEQVGNMAGNKPD